VIARPPATPPSAPREPTLAQLLALLREDRAANLEEWRYPGFQALLAYRLHGYVGQIRFPIARRLGERARRVLRDRAVRRYGIELADSAVIGRRVRIIHQNGIVIHPGAVIGDDCWIRQGAQVGSRGDERSAGPVLGAHVRLGVNVIVSGDVVVGDGAHLGPNGVVTEDVPASGTTMPARNRLERPN
jgi:serine O-acetyltransferase